MDLFNLRHKAEKSVANLPALMMVAQKTADNVMHGTHAKSKAGAGDKFWQFREYSPSDRPQDIDWRQSAKSDDVFIKQKELQVLQRNYIWVAGGKSMDFKSEPKLYTKQEAAQIMALSLAILLGRSEEQVGIFGDIKTGNSENSLGKIGGALINQADREEALPNTDSFMPPKNSGVIAIGDFLSDIEDIKRKLSDIQSNGSEAVIIQVLDPKEVDLTYKGRVKFCGSYSENQTTIDNVASVQEEYNSNIAAHIDAIKTLCEEQQFTYILHKTDDDITETLGHIIAKIRDKAEHK